MNKNFICLIDSGIGGISVLTELVRRVPNQNFLYFGDNQNAPYGNRTEYDLFTRTMHNIESLTPYQIKALVLACNTLSITVREKIEYYSGIKTFGVFPPVESTALKGGRALLLCTPFTANNIKKEDGLTVLPLKTLATEIEKNAFNLNNVDFGKILISEMGDNRRIKQHFNKRFDSVVLGCTHYSLIKNKIFDHFEPSLMISGETFTVKAVEKFIKNQKKMQKNSKNAVIFVGQNAKLNESFYKVYKNNPFISQKNLLNL